MPGKSVLRSRERKEVHGRCMGQIPHILIERPSASHRSGASVSVYMVCNTSTDEGKEKEKEHEREI
jgi:hypothetical protein